VSLDEFLPDFDVNEVHSTRVAAPPEAVLAAARAVTSREVPLLVVLMALRRLPAAIRRRRSPAARRALDAPLLDQMTRGGFLLLADRPDELVAGVVGRFWTPDGGIHRLGAAEFAGFEEPGFAKAAVNFRADAVPGGTLLTTETRIRCTDDASRRSFRRYWRIVMPGSAMIRRAWLRAIRLRAERLEIADHDLLDPSREHHGGDRWRTGTRCDRE
jgi:hypothetical protein